MKLGFVSAILGYLSLEKITDLAFATGYKCIEVCCWPVGKAERRYAGVTHIDVDTLDEKKAEYINGYMAEKGVSISGLGYYPNPLDPDIEKSNFFVAHSRNNCVYNGFPPACRVTTDIAGMSNLFVPPVE
jgi:sugar phosphate isomerase/epimerase